MSRLRALFRRVFVWLNAPSQPVSREPDLPARDWADLPPHHPKAEGTPC